MADQTAIMVVDDDPLVRSVVARLLADAGYPVLTAGDGDEALAMIDTLQGPLRLLITDVRMPVMDGPELAAHVRGLHPALPILFISGYSTFKVSDLPGPMLSKPFGPDALLAQVHRLLDAPGSAHLSA